MSKIIGYGYVLGIDNTKMYGVVINEKEQKSYRLEVEYDLIGLNKDDIIPERKFNMIDDGNKDVRFEFLDNYINDNITVEDLKKLKNVQ